MTFLIVDDSKVTRRLIIKDIQTHKSQLQEKAEFLEAGDGREALKIAAENKVDIAIVDWNMPQVDGLLFLKTIRQIESYKEIPIVMCTSEGEKSQVMEAMTSGATDYILKPLTGDKVWQKIYKYIT
jgi:two-component system, chemotaxis family, chemotaxis protein CheY